VGDSVRRRARPPAFRQVKPHISHGDAEEAVEEIDQLLADAAASVN
jgi:hypothetical protein